MGERVTSKLLLCFGGQAGQAGEELLVVDEAHYVKNPEAGRTKALVRMSDKADHVMLLGAAMPSVHSDLDRSSGTSEISRSRTPTELLSVSEIRRLLAHSVCYRTQPLRSTLCTSQDCQPRPEHDACLATDELPSPSRIAPALPRARS